MAFIGEIVSIPFHENGEVDIVVENLDELASKYREVVKNIIIAARGGESGVIIKFHPNALPGYRDAIVAVAKAICFKGMRLLDFISWSP